ncbi:FixH [mine drainage metagenome]|uniref:FixH n=1 Tax=mine drainage metagenome TaxID=410659 RepID=A0A1J5RLK7_9ZZZZ
MSAMTSTRRPGWWYPFIFVGVFLVVLAINLIMAYSAVHTFSGLQTEDAYEKGLEFNKILAQRRAQAELGWKVEAVLLPHDAANTERHDADLTVSYADRAGHPVAGLTVTARMVRPARSGHDLSVSLVEREPGKYVALVPLPLPGQWDMTVRADRGDVRYKLEQRVLVP